MDITLLQGIYVTTLGRAADKAGLDYWMASGLTLDQIAMSFFDQPETQILYPATLTNEELVQKIYVNIFGREGDADGIAYWVKELAAGTMKKSVMIKAMKDGATGDDAILIENKVKVAIAFSDGGLENPEDAAAILLKITIDVTSVDAALAEIAVLVATKEAEDENTTDLSEITLVTGEDIYTNLDGTVDSTITGDTTTYTDIDMIIDTSTEDNDVLNLSLLSGSTEVTVRNIETINLSLDKYIGENMVFDAKGVSGTNAINAVSTKGVAFDGELHITDLSGGIPVVPSTGISSLNLTAAKSTDILNITVNSEVTKLDITNTKTIVINTGDAAEASGDAAISYTPSAIESTTTIEGANGLILEMSATDVDKSTITDNTTDATTILILSEAGDVTLDKVTTDIIALGATGDYNLTLADKAEIELAVKQTGAIKIDNEEITGAYGVTVKTGVDVNELNVSEIDLSTTLDITATSKISNLITGGNEITVKGTGDLTLGKDGVGNGLSGDAINIYAEELTGKITVYSDFNDTNASDTDVAEATFLLGTNNDTFIQQTDLNQSTLTLITGAGDDTIDFTDLNATHFDENTSVTIVAAEGEADVLKLLGIDLNLTTANDSVKKFTVTGIETVELTAGEENATVALDAKSFSGTTVTFKGSSNTGETIQLNMASDETTLDMATFTKDKSLESLKVMGSSVADTITGGAGADTIFGGDGDDIIITGDNQDIVFGGDGDDTITLTKDSAISISKDTIIITDTNLSDVNNSVGTDTITGFEQGNGADIIEITLADANSSDEAGAEVELEENEEALVKAGDDFNLSLASSVIEFTTTLATDVTLSADSDNPGKDLKEALSSDAGAVKMHGDGNASFFVAYQNSNAYLYHIVSGTGTNAEITDDNISLLGVYEGIDGTVAGSFANGDFVIAE